MRCQRTGTLQGGLVSTRAHVCLWTQFLALGDSLRTWSFFMQRSAHFMQLWFFGCSHSLVPWWDLGSHPKPISTDMVSEVFALSRWLALSHFLLVVVPRQLTSFLIWSPLPFCNTNYEFWACGKPWHWGWEAAYRAVLVGRYQSLFQLVSALDFCCQVFLVTRLCTDYFIKSLQADG